jgi:hypothetical protein
MRISVSEMKRYDREYWFCQPAVPLKRNIDKQFSGAKSNALAN